MDEKRTPATHASGHPQFGNAGRTSRSRCCGAAAAGVPPGSITAETRSRDTIGNIWFTRPPLGAPGGQRIIVVTSDRHAARVRYLTQVIWGPGYRVTAEPPR